MTSVRRPNFWPRSSVWGHRPRLDRSCAWRRPTASAWTTWITPDEIEAAHYAFLVTEEEFDDIFARVTDRGLTYWADPGHTRENVINNHGRGFYFEDPSGHNLEVLTRPYGT